MYVPPAHGDLAPQPAHPARRTPRWRRAGPRVPGAAAPFALWALLVVALYHTACTLPALSFDDGTRWSGRDALWSALFPVFWIGDPRSLPAAASNVALAAAFWLGLAGRPRAAWRAALLGAALGVAAILLLRVGGPVVFDEGGVSRGQFQTLYPGGVLWLLSFAAAGVGALATRWGAAGGTRRRLAVGGAGLALAATTMAWKAHAERTLRGRVAAAIRADDASALESAFRSGGAPEKEYDARMLDVVGDIGRSRAPAAAAVAWRWRVRVPEVQCETAAGRRTRAALDEAAIATEAPVFVRLQLACGSSGTRNRYPAAWATLLDGALAARRVGVVVALVESGLDLRCPLARGGPPLDTLVHRRFGAPALERIQTAAGTSTAADVTDELRGCGFPDGAAR